MVHARTLLSSPLTTKAVDPTMAMSVGPSNPAEWPPELEHPDRAGPATSHALTSPQPPAAGLTTKAVDPVMAMAEDCTNPEPPALVHPDSVEGDPDTMVHAKMAPPAPAFTTKAVDPITVMPEGPANTAPAPEPVHAVRAGPDTVHAVTVLPVDPS
jgi:hypothetical protein